MKITRRFLAGAAVVALAGGTLAMELPAGATSTSVDVSNATVNCDTLTGSLKFSTPLNLGTGTGGFTTTVKGAVAGCTSSAVNAGGSFFTGTLSGTLTSSGSTTCTALLGTSPDPGTLTIAWKAPKGYVFTPTQTVGSKTVPASVIGVTNTNGAEFTVSGQGPWTSSYGQMQLGSTYGTTHLNITGGGQAFTGGDSGHASWLNGVFNLGAVDGLATCGGKGLKSVTFGIGSITLG